MNNHKRATPRKATPGSRKPKKIPDHATLSASCTAKRASGNLAWENPAWRHTNHTATAILRYRTVHTGPKTQLGGVQDGLRSVAYHVVMEGRVRTEPMPAAPRQIPTETAKEITCRAVVITRPRFVPTFSRARCNPYYQTSAFSTAAGTMTSASTVQNGTRSRSVATARHPSGSHRGFSSRKPADSSPLSPQPLKNKVLRREFNGSVRSFGRRPCARGSHA